MRTAPDLHCPPRYGTPRSPDRPTLGPQVMRISEKLGKPFLPHQRELCNVAFEINPDTGYLAYDEVIVIGPRQVTGKTELTLPVMTHRCTGFGDELANWVRRELGHNVRVPGAQRVLYTAQTADNAKEKWRDVHVERLQKSVFRSQIDVRLRTNFEHIRWPNGSTWSPGSATAKTGGTGDTLDLGLIDEAWSKPDSRTELGMRPAMMTRPWRQLWGLSMIPGISRAAPGTWSYLHTKRQNGRARVQAGVRSRVAYFEWSAAEDMDPANPDTWWSCMPALGHTVSEDTVRSDFEALGLVDFCAEYLGWEPDATAARWLVISEQTWRALAGIPEPRAYLEPIALGVHAAKDQSVASIGMAALSPSGETYVELVERQPGLTWAVAALVDLAKRMGPCAIGIAAHGPAAPIIEPLRRALKEENVDIPVSTDKSIVKALQGPALSRACRQFFLETGEVGVADQANPDRRIRHINQLELNDSVAQAQKYVYGDEWRFQQEGADPLYAVTLARAAGEDVEWLGGSYAVSDSLG